MSESARSNRWRLSVALFAGGLGACAPSAEPLPLELSEGDLAVVVVLSEQRRFVDLFSSVTGPSTLSVPEEGSIAVFRIPAGTLLDETQRDIDPSSLSVRFTNEPAPSSHGRCGRCLDAGEWPPMTVGPGSSCTLPMFSELIEARGRAFEGEGEAESLLASVLLERDGDCECQRHNPAGFDDLEFETLAPSTDSYPFGAGDIAPGGRLGLFSEHRILRIDPDGSRMDRSESARQLFDGPVLLVDADARGRFMVAAPTLTPTGDGYGFYVFDNDFRGTELAGEVILERFEPDAFLARTPSSPDPDAWHWLMAGYEVLGGIRETYASVISCTGSTRSVTVQCQHLTEPGDFDDPVEGSGRMRALLELDDGRIVAVNRNGYLGVAAGSDFRWERSDIADSPDYADKDEARVSNAGELGDLLFLCTYVDSREGRPEVISEVAMADLSRPASEVGASVRVLAEVPRCGAFFRLSSDRIGLGAGPEILTFDRDGGVEPIPTSSVGVDAALAFARTSTDGWRLIVDAYGRAHVSGPGHPTSLAYGHTAPGTTMTAIVGRPEGGFLGFEDNQLVTVDLAGGAPSFDRSLIRGVDEDFQADSALAEPEAGSILVAGGSHPVRLWRVDVADSSAEEVDLGPIASRSGIEAMAFKTPSELLLLTSDMHLFSGDGRGVWRELEIVDREPGETAIRKCDVGIAYSLTSAGGMAWMSRHCGGELALYEIEPDRAVRINVRGRGGAELEAALPNTRLHLKAARAVCADDVVFGVDGTGRRDAPVGLELSTERGSSGDRLLVAPYRGNAAPTNSSGFGLGDAKGIVGDRNGLSYVYLDGSEELLAPVSSIGRFGPRQRLRYPAPTVAFAQDGKGYLLFSAPGGRLVLGRPCSSSECVPAGMGL